ncbi:MAG: hypothetical protein ACTHWA_12265 [Arachnia sp.]
MSDDRFLSRRRPRALVWALLALLLLAATYGLVVFGWASDWGHAAPEMGMWWTVAFFAWGMLPFVLMGIVVLSFDRRLRGEMPVVVAGVLAIVGITVWGMTSTVTSQSSTTGLIFVFGPPVLLLVVGLATGVAAGLHALRSRRQRPRSIFPAS